MQIICNYTNSKKTGFTYQQIYKATKRNGLVYALNDSLKEVCLGGVALVHTAGISDSTYAIARFKTIES